MIERLAMENPGEYANLVEPMKKASQVRYREYIRETLIENSRRGNYIRIYPAKNSDMYDPFFQTQRPYNKVVYKILYSDEVLRGTVGSQKATATSTSIPGQIKSTEPISAYEQYKK